jgi:hypothetical protein
MAINSAAESLSQFHSFSHLQRTHALVGRRMVPVVSGPAKLIDDLIKPIHFA